MDLALNIIHAYMCEDYKYVLSEEMNLQKVIEYFHNNEMEFMLYKILMEKMNDFLGVSKGNFSQKLLFFENYYINMLYLLDELHKKMENQDVNFMTIKTIRHYPWFNKDVDILVDNLKKGKKVMIRNGYTITRSWREPKKFYCINLRKKGFNPPFHLHSEISWNGVRYLSKEVVLKRKEYYRTSGLEIPAPSIEDELMIILAHSLFENQNITLGELFNLYLICSSDKHLDKEYIYRSIGHENWLLPYNNLISYLNNASKIYFNNFLISDRNELKSHSKSAFSISNDLEFPLKYSYRFVFLSRYYKFVKDLCQGRLINAVNECSAYALDLGARLRSDIRNFRK